MKIDNLKFDGLQEHCYRCALGYCGEKRFHTKGGSSRFEAKLQTESTSSSPAQFQNLPRLGFEADTIPKSKSCFAA